MAPWANVEERLDEVNPTFDVYPLGKILWAMVSGKKSLQLWYWEQAKYNLEQLFHGEPEMRFVNKILQQTVVEDESDCLSSAAELLDLVDTSLVALRRGGQPTSDGLPRRCIVCGLGHYVDLYGGELHTLVLHQEPARMDQLTVRAFRCNQCDHVQFFQFPDKLAPTLWR